MIIYYSTEDSYISMFCFHFYMTVMRFFCLVLLKWSHCTEHSTGLRVYKGIKSRNWKCQISPRIVLCKVVIETFVFHKVCMAGLWGHYLILTSVTYAWTFQILTSRHHFLNRSYLQKTPFLKQIISIKKTIRDHELSSGEIERWDKNIYTFCSLSAWQRAYHTSEPGDCLYWSAFSQPHACLLIVVLKLFGN